MPDGPVDAAPVGRLTPHFHDISIDNLRSVNGDVAAIIVGLPESPVVGLTLKNVVIDAKKGVQVGYAKVSLDGVKVDRGRWQDGDDGRPGGGDGELGWGSQQEIEADESIYSLLAGCLLPKMAVPIRTQVEPSSMATAKSFDIPIERPVRLGMTLTDWSRSRRSCWK